ncbi:hypothetical protein L873DRAFT_1817575 [Choiromyces venosus 120613-1]|uniref:Secreted protein n=1 Tax=Choiromyces venosus 120613-1 TaxID=1336337 RepID=A0A3N4JF80_9PEZI|nr:hypothetical protein L873DRAFT_1817575 [Choiromyces venosus 120613-1]
MSSIPLIIPVCAISTGLPVACAATDRVRCHEISLVIRGVCICPEVHAAHLQRDKDRKGFQEILFHFYKE